MQSALRPYFTTGVAIVGASVIAAAPLGIPPAHEGRNIASAVQSVSGEVQLTALTDITGTFDTLINAALAGVALSLDLEAAVNVDADVATNFANLTGAVIEQISTAFGANPLRGLMDLVLLPVNVVTGLVSGLLGRTTGDIGGGLMDLLTRPITLITDLLGDFTGGMPGDTIDNIGELITAPIQLGLTSLETGTMLLTGLVDSTIEFGSTALSTALNTGAMFLDTAITAGAGFVDDLLSGASTLLTNSAAAILAALEPLAALPIIGPVVMSVGDVVGGLVAAGATVVNGMGTGIRDGAEVLTDLIADTVALVNGVFTGGAGLLTGVVDTGSTAVGDILTALPNALDAISGPPSGAAAMLAATRAGAEPPVITPLTAQSATAVTLPNGASVTAHRATGDSTPVELPPTAGDSAKAATSGSNTVTLPDVASPTEGAVSDTVKAGTETGKNFGKDVSEAATGSTGDDSGGGSGGASNKAPKTGKTASTARGAHGGVHGRQGSGNE